MLLQVKLLKFHIIQNIDDENNDGTSNSFYAHLQFLEEFFRLILQGINPDSLELLNKIILEVYNDKGINGKTDITSLHAKNYPTFDDLVKKIEENIKEKDKENEGNKHIEANTPYIVVADADMDDLVVKDGVLFNADDPKSSYGATLTCSEETCDEVPDENKSWQFVGTYNYRQWDSGNNVEEAKKNWLNGYTFNEHDIEPISVELTRIEDENENVFEIKG